MKDSSEDDTEEQLFLDSDLSHQDAILPLHTSITLFLISYCSYKSLKTYIVTSAEKKQETLDMAFLPETPAFATISRQELPPIARGCRLPVIVGTSGTFCRAGLAVVLRHIIQRSLLEDPSRKDVVELLGFKKTCLKACAEVSQWTRLCEISIPLAVQKFLQNPSTVIPQEILQLEKKLSEPVRVHNDDKLRRQKMQQQTKSNQNVGAQEKKLELLQSDSQNNPNLEMTVALSKLSVQELAQKSAREPSNIRKAKNADLPPLEHVFAEGLYFTLTDVVLLPCIHQFLLALHKTSPEKASELPLLAAWYKRVQQVPGVQNAALACKINFLHLPDLSTQNAKPSPTSVLNTEETECQEDHFIGGPRPTITKLKELCSGSGGIGNLTVPGPLYYSDLNGPSDTPVLRIPPQEKAATGCLVSLIKGKLFATKDYVEGLLPENYGHIHKLGTPRKPEEHGIEAVFSSHPWPIETIDWESLPAAVSPAEGKMSSDRAVRKQQQLNNLISVVKNLAKSGNVIVDFCSGGGHVGIALAYLLPFCQVILIENKEESLMRANERSNGLGLRNIWFIQANLDYFIGTFNVGVALHACGVATDMVIDHCISARASFVVCPCCYGFIQNTVKTTFPRSCRFQDVLTHKEHMVLCRFADQTAVQLPPERRLIGKKCMGLVDLDRVWAAEQNSYKAQVISMEPESCSPKNNVIVGSPV